METAQLKGFGVALGDPGLDCGFEIGDGHLGIL
jgi:hypothetical protein